MVSSVYIKMGEGGMVNNNEKKAIETSEKKSFAKCMIDGMDTTRASMTVFPITENLNEQEKNQIRSKRMIAALQWEKDLEVVAFTKEIMGITEPVPELPTKEEHVEKLYGIFDDDSLSLRERLVASDQISKIQGFIVDKKEQNTTVNNKIMIVTKSISDEEWVQKAKLNQENLIKGIIEVKAVDVSND